MKRIKIIAVLFVILTLASINLAFAQSSDDDPWSPPINLSQSAGTTNPVVVIDVNGNVHVVWQDVATIGRASAFNHSGYTFFDGLVWSAPGLKSFPFSPYLPLLLTDKSGLIHAFWINDDGALMASRVQADAFGDLRFWKLPRIIAESAVALDAVVDSEDEIHLVYIRTLEEDESPAGVYYIRSAVSGEFWGSEVPIYTSSYLRSQGEDDVNLTISYAESGEDGMVYVTWDNRYRKQVFFKRSSTNGDSWLPTQVIAGPDPNFLNELPFNLQVTAINDDLLLIWQVGEPGVACRQYYQISNDRGGSWSERVQMLEEFSACPEDNQSYPLKSGLAFLMTTVQGRPYMLAWNGENWSEPQLQDTLVGFEEPEIYTQVTLACQQGAILPNDQFFVVSCEIADDGGDIWASSRPLGDSETWYPPPPIWSVPEEITTGDQSISSPSLLIENEDRAHAIWTQVDASTGNSGKSILYSRWENERWSPPLTALESQAGNINNPSTELDQHGRIVLVWSDSVTGEMKFSWADAAKANSRQEWASEITLPIVREGIIGQDLLMTLDGRLLVAYSIPINEGRGVYLVESLDGGVTWESISHAYDGQYFVGEVIGQPQLTQTIDGALHISWPRLPTPGMSGPLSLHYIRSIDNGRTWSEPFTLTEGLLDWYQMITTGESNVHLTWLEPGPDFSIFNHQISIDSGITWSEPIRIAITGDLQGKPSLTADVTGSLHLNLIIKDQSNRRVLQHRNWDGERWNIGEFLVLEGYDESLFDQVSSDISNEGLLRILLSGMHNNAFVENTEHFLSSTNKMVVLSGEPVEVPLLPTVATIYTATSQPTPLTTPTITPLPPLDEGFDGGTDSSPSIIPNQWIGAILGVVVALLLVTVGVGFLLIRSRT